MTDELLHRLWTKAVGTPDYDKSEWKELEAQFWAKRPRWTDTPPTVPGWYWFRLIVTETRLPIGQTRTIFVHHVHDGIAYGRKDNAGGKLKVYSNTGNPKWTWQWAGPIPEPEANNE